LLKLLGVNHGKVNLQRKDWKMKAKVQWRVILSVIVICLAWVTAGHGQNEVYNPCFQIVADPDGSMWLATMKGAVNIRADGKVVTYDKMKGLKDDLVTQIFIDRDGSRWFVHAGIFEHRGGTRTAANGVSHLKKDGTIEVFGYHEGLPSGFVYGITADIDNTKWFATNSGAVHLKANGETEVFTEKNGLPGSNVRHIFIDKKGLRWFATDEGTVRMDREGKILAVHPK
jgi:ligand-binding sensor domain-containing protein